MPNKPLQRTHRRRRTAEGRRIALHVCAKSDVEALPEIVTRLGRELDAEIRPKSLQSG